MPEVLAAGRRSKASSGGGFEPKKRRYGQGIFLAQGNVGDVSGHSRSIPNISRNVADRSRSGRAGVPPMTQTTVKSLYCRRKFFERAGPFPRMKFRSQPRRLGLARCILKAGQSEPQIQPHALGHTPFTTYRSLRPTVSQQSKRI